MSKVNRRSAMKMVGVGGAAVFATVNPAHARPQKSKANAEPVVASKATQDRTGPRGMFAVVDRDGKLDRGMHVESVRRLDVGVYEVIFERDVRRGAYLATTGGIGYGGIPLPATAAVMGRATNPRGVVVYTTNLSSDAIDCGFHLAVICPDGYA